MSPELQNETTLARFKDLILKTCGFSLDMGREQTLRDGLNRRMAACGVGDLEKYHALLIGDNDELNRLVELLTVNETYFFREPDHLSMIADKLMPELLARRGYRQIRLLSAGCSTGEEPYSIAMMLRERYGADCERLFAITGVDIDSTAVASARNGVYGKPSFRGMDQIMLERYFEPAMHGTFRVQDSIRKLVSLDVVNLLGSFYPQGMQLPDIILYRNVSIYFPQQVQREIFSRLAEMLTDGGFLFVGATETMHHDIGILSLVERDSLFYYCKMPGMVIEERRAAKRHANDKDQTRTKSSLPSYIKAANVDSASATRSASLPAKRPASSKQAPSTAQLDSRELFDTALDLAQKGEYDKAIAIIDTIINMDHSSVKIFTLKASLLLSASRFEEAGSVCNYIIDGNPLCLEAYLMLGLIARHERNEEKALKRFREAIYLDTSCWLAHFYTAEILFTQKEIKRARSGYETAARILGKGSIKEHGQAFFPLSFNAEQFIVICQHKLSLLKETR